MGEAMSAYIAQFEAMATKAAPFLDQRWDGRGWAPSYLLRIGFYVLLTGRRPEQSATFANDMLETARENFRMGRDPNPFRAEVSIHA